MQLATHRANQVSVRAATILEVTDITERTDGCGQSWPDLMLRLSDGRNFKANSSMTARYVPVAGDYLVTQEDGYEYLNPKDVFERKYSTIPVTADDNAPLPEVSPFVSDLSEAINRNSKENGSNTPDFILAEFMFDCLIAFDKATKRRRKWYTDPNEGAPATLG